MGEQQRVSLYLPSWKPILIYPCFAYFLSPTVDKCLASAYLLSLLQQCFKKGGVLFVPWLLTKSFFAYFLSPPTSLIHQTTPSIRLEWRARVLFVPWRTFCPLRVLHVPPGVPFVPSCVLFIPFGVLIVPAGVPFVPFTLVNKLTNSYLSVLLKNYKFKSLQKLLKTLLSVVVFF